MKAGPAAEPQVPTGQSPDNAIQQRNSAPPGGGSELPGRSPDPGRGWAGATYVPDAGTEDERQVQALGSTERKWSTLDAGSR